jgi:ABC-2 type transport system ATP-binding protein
LEKIKSIDTSIVEFCNVSKNFLDIHALEDISFKVKKGEILGYIGPNGAGKTTSLKILVGLIQTYTGNVLIKGSNIRNQNLIAHQIGYMPQETGFQEWRTVKSALWTFGRLSGMDSTTLSQRIAEILNLVGLPDVENRKIVNLSGGMQQKLKLSQALIHNPEILIMDEPMNGLDPASRYSMKNLIRELANQGKTIIFSSHILADVQDVAHNIAILNHGHILKINSPDALRNQFQVGFDLELKVKADSALCPGLDLISGVESVINNGSIQIIHVNATTDLDEVITQIMKISLEHHIKVRNLNLLYASLEDVYLKLVGGESH